MFQCVCVSDPHHKCSWKSDIIPKHNPHGRLTKVLSFPLKFISRVLRHPRPLHATPRRSLPHPERPELMMKKDNYEESTISKRTASQLSLSHTAGENSTTAGSTQRILRIQTRRFFLYRGADVGAGLIKRKLGFGCEVWNLNQSLFLNRRRCSGDKYFSSGDKRDCVSGLLQTSMKRGESTC